MKKIITDILLTAVHAASGDNSQPWRFEVKENKIYIYNLPEKDNPILNFEQSGSYIAHGGLIENINIISKSYGYSPLVRSFPDPSDPVLTAVIEFETVCTQTDPLYRYVKSRCTNRRPYKKTLLSEAQRKELLLIPEKMSLSGQVKIILLESAEQKITAAKAGSSMEQVILENHNLHSLMFNDVLWTERENQEKISGLFIKTMEFAFPVKIIFWLAGLWPIIKLLNKIGLAKFIANQDAKLYSSGAAMGAIVMENSSKEAFINAGRLMQRLWLEVTRMGLNLQPITAILFAGRRVRAGETVDFSPKHIKIIKENFFCLQRLFELKQNETLAMMFRIGEANPPSGRTVRFPPNIKFIS